jgi:hypothetical protein
MNAIKLLKEDHNELRGFFQSFKASDSKKEKHNIFKQIKAKLDVHTHIEETIFYPELINKKELEDITKEGIEEHHVGDVLVREISNLTDDSEKFEPKMEVLIESTEHHLQEEEGKMFPKVEEHFSESELEELGTKMQEEKQTFKKSQSASA